MIVGSTGRPKWSQLSEVEQNKQIQARAKGNKTKAKKVTL
jgi:hypothetical protein